MLARFGVCLGLVGLGVALLLSAIQTEWDHQIDVLLYAVSGLLCLAGAIVFAWPLLARVRPRWPLMVLPANRGADELRRLWESSAQQAFEGVKRLLTTMGSDLRGSGDPWKALVNALVNNGLVQQAEQARAAFTNPFVVGNVPSDVDVQEAFGGFYYRYQSLCGSMHQLGRLTGLTATDPQYEAWAAHHNRFMAELRGLIYDSGFETLRRRVEEPGWPLEPGEKSLRSRPWPG